MWLTAPLFLAGGVLLLVGTVKQFRNERGFLGTAIRTRGVVEDLVLGSGPRAGRFPVVRFTTLKGVTVSATSNSTRSGFRVGQEVSIVYDPDDPTHMAIDAYWARWGGTAGLGFFAALCLFIGAKALLSLFGLS